MEEWRPVVGWEGIYEVSSLGRVRSVERTVYMGNRWGNLAPRRLRSKVLKTTPHKFGYPMVGLHFEGFEKKVTVHRLVCIAFHGPSPAEGLDVAHNDGDPTNCRKENLRWDTRTGNMADTLAHGTRQRGEGHKLAKLSDEEVREIRRSRHVRPDALAEKFGVRRGYIYELWRGEKRKSAK